MLWRPQSRSGGLLPWPAHHLSLQVCKTPDAPKGSFLFWHHCHSHWARMSTQEHPGCIHDAVKYRTPNPGCTVDFREMHPTINNSISLWHKTAHFSTNLKKVISKIPGFEKNRPYKSSKICEQKSCQGNLVKTKSPNDLLLHLDLFQKKI